MGRAQARVRVDDYLSVPRHGRPDLRVVDGERTPEYAAAAEPAALRSLRPDWLPEDLELPTEAPERGPVEAALERAAAAEPRPAAPEPRRTVVVTGRPEDDLRFESYGKKKRHRRSPTAARLAGRPDRVAGWAVALGVVMALMAGATAGSDPKPAGEAATPQPPALAR